MRRRGARREVWTVMFTDISGSTELATELGDLRWRAARSAHDEVVRREIRRWDGREIDTSGDGFFVAFERPTNGVACGVAISDAVRSVGIDVRIGMHMGEVEAVGDQLVGIAVHVGARVSSLAVAGEILVTSTLRESMAGSKMVFEDRGTHKLEGVPGEWRIFAVARNEATRPAKAPFAVDGVDEESSGGGSVVALMFTDVVGATRLAAQLGDEGWRKLLIAHDLMIRRNLDRFDGRKVDQAGDRVLATFDRTTQAVDCARAILDAAPALGVEMRIGIHVGEVEMVGPKVGGTSVHVGARVLTISQPGELLVTSTAKDSLLGTRRLFEDRGIHRLKGLADEWHVYAVREP